MTTTSHASQPSGPAPDPVLDSSGGARGQTRFALQFARLYTGQFLYVHGLDQWHFWDGARWALDRKNDVQKKLIRMLNASWSAALENKDLATDIRAAMSASAQRGILDIAASLDGMKAHADELDANPFQLNTPSGTLDLLDLQLHPHNPMDFITKVTNASFDTEVDTSYWEKFLATVLPDEQVRAYLQRFTGLALLGAVREHILGIATGTGANGKGTFYLAVSHALGDYAHAAESDLFMTVKSNANAASPAVLGLRGARWITCSETEEGMALAAALMKNLTGGDPITARPLYGRPITFEPSHTALMVTNFLPVVKGSDSALFRRIRVIPFDVVIPEDQRDGELGEKLKAHADAILAWAIAGWLDYQANGMQTPDAVTRRTDQYRNDSDDYARFFAENLDITGNPDDRSLRSELWQSWERYIQDGGALGKGKPADFYSELEKHGAKHCKISGARGYAGVRILLDSKTDEDEILNNEE